ncbi:MAG: flippase-like domain-containing protein [Acidobacteria bacterium]|nr:flippase-like domain-containing protein [Acidobacteriota bacterium]
MKSPERGLAPLPFPSPSPARILAGYAVALGVLVWVFHDMDGRRILGDLARVSWGWALVSAGLDIFAYRVHGLRWALLLGGPGHVPVNLATRAIFAGLFVNEFLPFRPGEFLRPWLVARERGTPYARVLPTVGVERLLDGFWLFLLAAVTATLVPLPGALLRAALVLGLMIVPLGASFLILVALYSRRRPAPPLPENHPAGFPARGRVRRFLLVAGEGLRATGFSRNFWGAFAVSAGILIVKTAALAAMIRAWGFPLGTPAVLVVFCVLRLGTAMPNTPANVGTHQFLVTSALVLFGVDRSSAGGFAGTGFLVATVPLAVLGALAFARSGLFTLFRRSGPGVPAGRQGSGETIRR